MVPITGHSLPLVSLGGFILIMGFMAFNGGSQASISKPGDGEAIGRAIQSTLVACGTGGSTVLILYKFVIGGTWSLPQIINGCLAGLCDIFIKKERRDWLQCCCFQAWSVSAVDAMCFTLCLLDFSESLPALSIWSPLPPWSRSR